MITVYSATAADVWPDPFYRPASKAVEDAIFVEAKRVTADDIERCGLNAAPWYCAFYIAQHRVEARIEAEKELAKADVQRRQSPPQPKPVAKGSVHPSAKKWELWPKSAADAYANETSRKHSEDWRRKRVPLAVYRPSLDDRQAATISDCRKIFRETLVYSDMISEALVFYVNELYKRIKDLEERRMPEYRGIWSEGEDYDESSLVTSGGSLWISSIKSKGVRPGDGKCWELAAKKGRDGRHCAKDT